jgi:heme exporter protein A
MMRLSAVNLTCRRGGRPVFSDLSFSLAAGEALVVTGRNGAGKSSLLRLIVGLLPPDSGHVSLDGGDAERSIGEQAHYLGHLDAIKPSLTVEENLRFWSAWLGPAETPPRDALQRIGLDTVADLPAAYLSAGQRRRLSLARLIAVHRPIWLLDEPGSALDSEGQLRLADLMTTHLNRGGLILAAAHGPIGLKEAQEIKLGRTQ